MSDLQMSDLISVGATVKLLVDALAKAFPRWIKDGTTVLLVVALAFGLAAAVVFAYAFREVIYAGMIILASALGIDVSRHWSKVQRGADILGVDLPDDAPQSPRSGERTQQVSQHQSTPYGSSDVTRGA